MSTKTRTVQRALAATVGAAAILLTAACGGGGEGSPEDLGNAAAEAISNKDVEAVKNLTCEAQKDEVKEEEFDFAKDMPESFKDVKPVAEFSGVENATDESATIKMKIKLENLPAEAQGLGMDAMDIPIKAIKEDGNWVMCP
jgi:hypothetical protein